MTYADLLDAIEKKAATRLEGTDPRRLDRVGSVLEDLRKDMVVGQDGDSEGCL